jgi:hypothetical protein
MRVKELLLHIWSFGVNLGSAFGFLFLVVEIAEHQGDPIVASNIKEFWWIFGLLGLAYAIIRIIPKGHFEFKVPNRDATIYIRQKNIFRIKGSLVVPINNIFKVNQDGDILASNSILSQVIKRFYNKKPEQLQTEIDRQLNNSFYINYRNGNEYNIGTVVPVQCAKRKFYFLANTKLNSQNRSYCDDDMFEKSLNELWVYLSDSASKEAFIIPLIGTGNGRLNTEREIVFKEILLSFLSSLSAKNYAESLTICLNPKDIQKHEINFKDIGEFSEAKIKYQDYRNRTIAGTNRMP